VVAKVRRKRANVHAQLRRTWRKDGTYDRLWEEQEGLCGICRKPPYPGKVFDIDHDHSTDMARGLLHRGCNLKLGRMKDPEWFEGAAIYLRRRGYGGS
jgi:hypothetical protein